MDDNPIDAAALREILAREFAPWIAELALEPVSLEGDRLVFRAPRNERLSRGGGVICGQAIGAISDTVSVLALCRLNGRFRNCTTVDMTTHFTRPAPAGPLLAEVTALSNGRRLAVTRVDLRAEGAEKPAAGSTCAFLYLED